MLLILVGVNGLGGTRGEWEVRMRIRKWLIGVVNQGLVPG